MRIRTAIAAWVCLVALSWAMAEEIPSQPGARVNDLAGLLQPGEAQQLESLLQTYEQESSCQLVLLTIKSLDGGDVHDVAVRTFERWKLGSKANNNGVLMLIALDDRKIWIEVGYGLEGRLTDAITSSIYRNTITPALRQRQYYEGIRAGFEQIIAATRGEYTAPENTGSSSSSRGSISFIVFFAIVVLLMLLAKAGSSGMGSAMGGKSGRGRTYWTGGPGGFSGGDWGSGGGGGFFGGGGGGGGGFGGFSGGGGMSGGGGAGGSW